ncbi:MAG TPA: ABC transporter ATP-binding protein [Beutenbergiaceae bacterium]|nr:ABC transporter ATP-binding protein [Beutenbergiaceae bacterium]
MSSHTTVLQARGVTKAFEQSTVLHGVDLKIRSGEFVAVMGPSGSGKSTFLYALSGMDAISAGSVHVAGSDLSSLDQKALAQLRLTTMGFIFQHVHLLKNLSVLDNIVLPAYYAAQGARTRAWRPWARRPRVSRAQSSRAQLRARALELMARTGIADLADRDITAASGGQLQRVGICRALINEPMLLLGDEPTGALDSAAAGEVMDILTDLNAQGMTLMLVTHDARIAARAGRVAYMLDGQIVAERNLGPLAGQDLDTRHRAVAGWLATAGS